MLDHVDYDIVRLSHVNRLMEDGEAVFGEQFIDRLNQMVKPIRGASYRKIPHVVMRPSTVSYTHLTLPTKRIV